MTVSSTVNRIYIKMKKKDLWVVTVILTSLWLFSSCSSWEPDLGQDLLPAGDQVFLYQDTIIEVPAYTVSGIPLETSDRSYSPTTPYLLGKVTDSITGVSEASLFTQYNITSSYRPARNTEIDSLVFSLYLAGYYGNTEESFTIQLHEATRRVYMDSLYYSNFDMEGAYNPEILAEVTVTPQVEGDTVPMLIQNQAFIQKFLDVQDDSALFSNDSIFKDYFNGFYLTASSNASEGAIAVVIPSNIITRLSLKYANDSTELDSTAERDFRWATFTINEFVSQKINIFEHDYSGTSIEGIIDNPGIETPYCYVQGMGGVSTSFYFGNLQEWLDRGGEVAINSATMVFDVCPEENGGLAPEDQPERLMMYYQTGQDTLAPLYDLLAIFNGTQGDDSQFGGQLKPISKGMFFDTTYSYQFKIPLHLQSMVDGASLPNDFILQTYDAKRNPKISKIWSNLYTNPKRIRLEVVYIKL